MVPLIDFGPLKPSIPELVASVVFAIILWIILAKAVVPRFEKMYEERRDAITGGMERAEQAQAEAKAAQEQYTQELTALRAEAAQIREEAKNTGAQIVAEMREQANAESARIVANARAQIEAERSQVMEQLRAEVGGLATTLAGRILGESLDDDERTRRTVDRFIADLERPGSSGPAPATADASQS